MKTTDIIDRRLTQIVPDERQIRFQETEFYAFVHFSVNTYTDREWGDGTEPESLVCPDSFDAAQWADAIRSAGMKGLILTCKHHDGFCLWPSRYTNHTIAGSPFRGGKGDPVKEAADACRESGLRFGIYLSPWDRNNESYGSGKAYDDFFVNQLTELLNQMARREIFAEDFYRKPIEAMLSLTDHAGQVLRQLVTTLQSYENLMEKIQVDIAIVEEEKSRIAELFGEYVHEVHQNLSRIDQNSTITIRDKNVRMLKITLPDWEKNESLYQTRIRDFMEEITQRGIELSERNENTQEYLGVRLTTKNLYDVVVGIETVQIHLHKIEEQRQYEITWSQVARNSGGEGFLSAFIILSSLLYYMRRDESDLFADRNEGKVLLMDNPFAQTNASHLLRPLMEMAKKTNTQLICLSGLGGESIYNRFDNIYVLNLIAAGLHSGMQYVKAEHMRGRETETMLVSQIEVLGQQELIF